MTIETTSTAANAAPATGAATPSEGATFEEVQVETTTAGWPVGITREEYATWRDAQKAKGVEEPGDVLEYKRLKDAGLVDAPAPAADPAAPPAAEAPEPAAEEPKVEEKPAAKPLPPIKSNVPASDLAKAIEAFVLEQGAQAVHRAWSHGMREQGREVKEELRLFPRLPEEDVALDRSIALAVLDAFAEYYVPTVQRAAATVVANAQPYDGIDELNPEKGRWLVQAADLHKLGVVLNTPAGDGRDRITFQSLDGGAYLAFLNELLAQADKQLTANGNHGEVQVLSKVKVVAEDGSFLRKISSVGELKLGKLERQEFRTDAASKGGGLTLWTHKSAMAHAKEEADQAEANAKANAAKGKEVADKAIGPKKGRGAKKPTGKDAASGEKAEAGVA